MTIRRLLLLCALVVLGGCATVPARVQSVPASTPFTPVPPALSSNPTPASFLTGPSAHPTGPLTPPMWSSTSTRFASNSGLGATPVAGDTSAGAQRTVKVENDGTVDVNVASVIAGTVVQGNANGDPTQGWSSRFTDGATFYVGAKTGQLPAALGQTTMAGSVSVAIASNQSPVPVTGTFTMGSATTITDATPSVTVSHTVVTTVCATRVGRFTALVINHGPQVLWCSGTTTPVVSTDGTDGVGTAIIAGGGFVQFTGSSVVQCIADVASQSKGQTSCEETY